MIERGDKLGPVDQADLEPELPEPFVSRRLVDNSTVREWPAPDPFDLGIGATLGSDS